MRWNPSLPIISSPVFSYPYPGYSNFKTAQASRAGTVYMGANDGMMHAFAADTGVERWAYVPSMVIPNMWKLADTNYATLHVNFVNGSPITTGCMHRQLHRCGNCRLEDHSGGRPERRRSRLLCAGHHQSQHACLLWEFTTTAGIGSTKDDDLGYSYGAARHHQKGRWHLGGAGHFRLQQHQSG